MTMTDQSLTAAERVALHRRTRAATAEQVAAASAIRRATADPATADVAADILALHYVAAAAEQQRPDVATALALVAREQQGRTAHTSRTAERATATAAESAGYFVPRETLAESAARLVRQRWGKRAASVTATALAADHDAVTAYVAEHFADVAEDKRPIRLAARTLYIGHRLAAARVKDHRHVAAFVAALLADAPTLTADHDAATCTNPKCYRCTAALNPQGKRASTAPVRAIGLTGPLTAPRQGKREGYRRTATAPKERTTPRAIHLLRESSAWAALDLARSHSATSGPGGESTPPPRDTSPLVVAALLALTSADGRGERAHVAERAAGLPRVAAEQGKRAARATALATSTAEQGRWCAWWATRATSTADRAAAAAEQVKCERATAVHRRTATRAAAAAALATAEGRVTLDPSKLTAAATAVAVHAVGAPALRRAARHYWSTELAAALAACETAERATSSKRAAAYRTWAADKGKRAATARAALAALALAEQRAATALAAEQRAAAAALASAWGVAATLAHVRGPAAATAAAAALRPPLALDHVRAIGHRDDAVAALAAAERAAERALIALAAHQGRTAPR